MKQRQGISLLEMLMTLAVLGIALALVAGLTSPSQTHIFANDLKAMFQQARFEAIKRNVAVAVVWNASEQAFEMRANTANATSCNPDTLLQRHALSNYRQLSVSLEMAGSGMLWLPTGLPRGCSGSLPGGQIVISDTKRSITVNISQGGRIDIE